MKPASMAAALVAGWALLALLAGWFQWFLLAPPIFRPAIPILLALGFYVLFASSDRLQARASLLPIRFFLAIGSLRLFAIYILTLWLLDSMPSSFALTAGLGSAAFGAISVVLLTASPATLSTQTIRIWNIAGFVEAVFVLSMVLVHVLSGRAGELAAFRTLPANLMPTFVIPLSLLMHAVLWHSMRSRAVTSPA